ncbi:hypothetical protein Tco_1274882, partial [Tanacetum coccineum]
VAQSLLELQTPKKSSTTYQYIFQRWILVTKDASTGPSAQLEDDISANIVRDTPSPTDAETGAGTDKTNSERDTEILNIGEEQGEDVADKVNLEEKTAKIDEGHARSDPGWTNPGQSHVALARLDPGSMHDDFVATMYPQIHESLMQPNEEHVYMNDKPTKEEPDKANMESEVESMVTVSIHQASSSVPPLSTLVIDLTPSKPVSSTTQAPIFTATIATTTTTLPLLPPPQQQSSSDPNLASFFSALEQVCANFEKRYKLQDKTVQVNEVVKEVVQVALQAPLKERFRDISEADMKEILHDQLFESGSYRSLPEHVALYEALEASTEHENRDAFLVKKDKSRKRRQDDQDPPLPPSKEPDQSKKKKYDSDASGSIQTPAQTSSAWKTSDTRDALSSFQDIPIPNDVHVSNTKDTNAAHLLKIKPRPNWLKPIPEEERLKTPELDWVVPPNDLPKPRNNWANAFATSYKDPEENKLLQLYKDLKENKLLQKTGDIGSFIKWFCRQIRKLKLSKDDLEGSAYKIGDLVNLEGHHVVPDVSKPLPLGGPPGQVTIQPQFLFNKDLEYLVSGSKERRNALSISKLKAANYPDFRLEELVSSLWIKSEREYDISAAHGISHWWFKRKEFYINRHSSPFNRRVVRSYMRILSVVGLKTISRYSYTYLKDIVLRIADYNEYKISESDFKNLHPNDFEDLDRNDQKKMMRETKVHKFSDGTLNRILDKLDHMVKDFKLFKYNPSMETRIWSEDDRMRSKEFMEVIEGRLKIRRIFRSLESFISGRLRDVDYRLIQRTE